MAIFNCEAENRRTDLLEKINKDFEKGIRHLEIAISNDGNGCFITSFITKFKTIHIFFG